LKRCSPSVDHRVMIALQRSPESAVHVPERFRAVAPSAVLVKGLSPDSSYRDGAHDTEVVLQQKGARSYISDHDTVAAARLSRRISSPAIPI
jgi:hypothetical protein